MSSQNQVLDSLQQKNIFICLPVLFSPLLSIHYFTSTSIPNLKSSTTAGVCVPIHDFTDNITTLI